MRNHRARRRRMRLFMSLHRSNKHQQPALTEKPLAPRVRWAAAMLPAIALTVALAGAAQPARAQVSFTASVASEYSARGKSLSKGRLAPQLRVDVDAASGWYAGALLSRAALPYSDTDAQVVAYGGYAQEMVPGTTWEAGVLDASFVGDQEYHYHEFYVGLARDRLAARVYFSPSYYGGGKSLYAELNGSWPLRERLALVGHVGLLHPFSADHEEDRQRLDLRVGLGYDVGAWNFQLALLASGPQRHGEDAPRAISLSASYGF
jgi:uncharacterized protein (TIGR02001 family)